MSDLIIVGDRPKLQVAWDMACRQMPGIDFVVEALEPPVLRVRYSGLISSEPLNGLENSDAEQIMHVLKRSVKAHMSKIKGKINGSKKLGSTFSGKVIYEYGGHDSHKFFTYQDRNDAIELHKERLDDLRKKLIKLSPTAQVTRENLISEINIHRSSVEFHVSKGGWS